MPGRLTTHVLDTAAGRPAAGVEITVLRDGAEVARTVTNADGRTDAPLVEGAGFAPGTYELRFDVAAYFADRPDVSEPPFLDVVPVRVTIADDTHHHVPLLVSPWAYSTYRGS